MGTQRAHHPMPDVVRDLIASYLPKECETCNGRGTKLYGFRIHMGYSGQRDSFAWEISTIKLDSEDCKYILYLDRGVTFHRNYEPYPRPAKPDSPPAGIPAWDNVGSVDTQYDKENGNDCYKKANKLTTCIANIT